MLLIDFIESRKGFSSLDKEKQVADRVGFEPTVEFPLHTLSKRAP